MRRVIDLMFAISSLVILLPIMLLIAILIKIDSVGPILYAPPMIGKDGQVFLLLRFRTRSVRTINRPLQQRLTRVGKFIRNYSLDHLPMLINLLLGHLTLVGPRPLEREVVNFQDKTWQKYFTVKPGLFNYAVLKMGNTWTPNRESHPSINQELELEYLQQRSTMFDLRLIMKSLGAFITSKGNIKARGEPDPDMESRLNHIPDYKVPHNDLDLKSDFQATKRSKKFTFHGGKR
jgi:lipopolysaccharide/colanic/teichoic acid biosynthesis glycosyltransferase